MNPHDHDPGPLDEREAAAFAALDHRGRAAAAALRAAVAATLAAEPPAEPGPQAGDAPRPGHADAAAPGVRSVDAPLPGYAAPVARPPRRGWLVAAAAAVVAVAVGAAAVALQGDSPPTTSSGGGTLLLPDWLPDDFAPGQAVDGRTVSGILPDGRVVVYGRAGEPDPWAGPTIAVVRVEQEWLPDGEAEVTAGSRRASVVGDAGWPTYAWSDGGATVGLVARGVSEAETTAAIAATTAEPAVPAEALPPGFGEIARGGTSATARLPGLRYGSPGDSLSVVYYPGGGPRPEPTLVVRQRPGAEAEVDLARLGATESRPAEVRGRHAAAVTAVSEDGTVVYHAVQWWEEGMLVTVGGTGLSEEAVVRVAEGMRPAARGEMDDLLAAYAVPIEESVAAGTAADIAGGTEAGYPWTLEATEGADSNGLGLAWGDGQVSVGWDPAEGPGDLLVEGSQSAGWPGSALFGAAAERVASVSVEGPGLPARNLELYDAVVGETPIRVFVVFPPPGWGGVTVVARDESGAEVARDSVIPAT